MNIVSYLKDIYGYGTPIFLKDIRIGRKSKTAIRKELSRAVKEKEIIRRSQGVYYFKENKELARELSFEAIVEKKYIKDDFGIKGLEINTYGYYSGQTFLNQIGISQQVPAVLEITTNNTSCKRIYHSGKYRAILRKGRTTITYQNCKALQFFDMISDFLTVEEVRKNKDLLTNYIKRFLDKNDFTNNIQFYSNRVAKIIVEEGLIYAFR